MSMDEQSGNFADETTQTSEAAETMSEIMAHHNEELRKRRSTRIMQAVPLSVTGVDALGRPFTERTSTLIINCHGCRYQSKHYVLKNMWVTLEVPHPEAGQPPRTVRGRVAWIQRPRTVRQLFQVALELETPGNTWGIAFPPPDWFAPAEPRSAPHIQEVAHEAPLSQESSKTAEIHLPLTEPESAVAASQDNLRVFPAPASATDASLQLARHMARLVADAKQQLQATAREIAAQAVGAERRVSAEEWEHKIASAREQLAQQVAGALQKIQEESEARWRTAHNAAAEALQRELPAWIAPQLQQLTRELAQQISDRGTTAREEQTQHIASALEALRSVCQQAEESATRLRAQSEETHANLANRVTESTRTLEEIARQREVTANTHREALEAAANELQQRLTSSMVASQAAWQGQLATELSAAEARLRSSVEATVASAQEKANAALGEHAAKASSQVQEELSRQTAATREAIAGAVAEAEQRVSELRSAVQEDVERQAAAVREAASAAIAAAEQHFAGLHGALQEDATRQASAARDSIAGAAAEAEQRVAALRSAVSEAAEQHAVATRDAAAVAVAAAEQHLARLRGALQDDAARQVSAARESISGAASEAEQHLSGLRNSLQEQSRQLESALTRAFECTDRLEHLSARMDTTQRQALAGFESQIDDVLTLHRNELHRSSETLLEEINARINSTFEDSCQRAISQFDEQVEAMVQPHISRTEEAIHRLAGGRSLLDAAMTLQQDRIRASADEAFAESLARFRENLGGVDQLLQDAANTVSSRTLADYEAKIANLKHQTFEDMMKSAEWYEKKAQTQIESFTEKTVEQAESQFREKAGEVSSVFASELDHSSRSFIGHTQRQMEEVVRDAFEQSRALFAEAAETTTAAFTDEIQRQARNELDGFTTETQRALNDTRSLLDASRAALAQQLTAEQEAFLREFRARMTSAVETEVSGAHEKVQSSLGPLLDSWRSTVEAHRKQMRSAYQELSNQATELHRGRLENVSNQWMLATVASLNQQSREAVASIAAMAEEKLRETCGEVFANVGESLRERLQQIASGFAPRQPQTPASPETSQPPASRSTTAGGGSS